MSDPVPCPCATRPTRYTLGGEKGPQGSGTKTVSICVKPARSHGGGRSASSSPGAGPAPVRGCVSCFQSR
eukprot:5878794-Prymnesium_polylepis.1